MSLPFAKITIEQLKKEIESCILATAPELDIAVMEWAQKHPQISKDLDSFVKFDHENFYSGYEWDEEKDRIYFINDEPNGCIGYSKFCGYQSYENGLTFLGCWGGGDWEVAVHYIVYWDGKSLRGYVPTLGNPWNTHLKLAYGNDCGYDDLINLKDRLISGTLVCENINTNSWLPYNQDIDDIINENYEKIYNFKLMKQDILNTFK